MGKHIQIILKLRALKLNDGYFLSYFIPTFKITYKENI